LECGGSTPLFIFAIVISAGQLRATQQKAASNRRTPK
jgi:hypothetical protein